MYIQLNEVHPKNKIQLKQLIKYAFRHNIYDLNFIDTSKITDMSYLFSYRDYYFDVSTCDVSNVTDMNHMFFECKNFIGKGLENWDVSKIKDMHSMFYGCKKLNCDLSDWDVSFVSDFSWTFYRCDKMTIPKWYIRIMNDASKHVNNKYRYGKFLR